MLLPRASLLTEDNRVQERGAVCLVLPEGRTVLDSPAQKLKLLERTYLWRDVWMFLIQEDPFLLRRATERANSVLQCRNSRNKL